MDLCMNEMHRLAMRFGRRRPASRELSDYSVVAAAVRKRRAERSVQEKSGSAAAIAEEVARAYRPREILFERCEQARVLVNDVADIPRTWEPDWPSYPRRDPLWELHVCLWSSLAIQVPIILFTSQSPLDPASNIILLGAAALSAVVLLIAASVYLDQKPALARFCLAVGIMELLSIAVAACYVLV
jgi:hypothetical protein